MHLLTVWDAGSLPTTVQTKMPVALGWYDFFFLLRTQEVALSKVMHYVPRVPELSETEEVNHLFDSVREQLLLTFSSVFSFIHIFPHSFTSVVLSLEPNQPAVRSITTLHILS